MSCVGRRYVDISDITSKGSGERTAVHVCEICVYARVCVLVNVYTCVHCGVWVCTNIYWGRGPCRNRSLLGRTPKDCSV